MQGPPAHKDTQSIGLMQETARAVRMHTCTVHACLHWRRSGEQHPHRAASATLYKSVYRGLRSIYILSRSPFFSYTCPHPTPRLKLKQLICFVKY